MPATSSNVTRTCPASTGLAALDLPSPPSPPPIMLAPRRMIQIHRPARSSTGSSDSSRLEKKPRVIGLLVITTWPVDSCWSSWSVLAKAGISVAKRV